jgi:predicted phosphoribosyltransferase
LKVTENRVIIVIDDGLATGVTAAAAGRYLKKFNPEKLILAVPVAPKHIHDFVKDSYDEVVSLHYLADFNGVGEWYQNFTQVQDHDVLSYLGKESLFLPGNFI